MNAKELAKKIKDSDQWILEDCRNLCELAGLSEEWENADGDDFENILNLAAEKLGVEIY